MLTGAAIALAAVARNTALLSMLSSHGRGVRLEHRERAVAITPSRPLRQAHRPAVDRPEPKTRLSDQPRSSTAIGGAAAHDIAAIQATQHRARYASQAPNASRNASNASRDVKTKARRITPSTPCSRGSCACSLNSICTEGFDEPLHPRRRRNWGATSSLTRPPQLRGERRCAQRQLAGQVIADSAREQPRALILKLEPTLKRRRSAASVPWHTTAAKQPRPPTLASPPPRFCHGWRSSPDDRVQARRIAPVVIAFITATRSRHGHAPARRRTGEPVDLSRLQLSLSQFTMPRARLLWPFGQ